MVTSRTASLPRCTAVWLGATLAAGALVNWLLPTITAGPDPVRLDRTLVWGCAVAALVVGGWWWLVTGLVALEALTGRAETTPGIPAPVRRVVLAACGVALVGGLAVPAVATPGRPHEARGSVTLAGLPLPDRAVSTLPGGAHLRSGPVRASAPETSPETETETRGRAAVVVVAPGDSLWAIASRDLGPGATDAEIGARWREIYAANRDVIGADPDLVRPALRLQLPIR